MNVRIEIEWVRFCQLKTLYSGRQRHFKVMQISPSNSSLLIQSGYCMVTVIVSLRDCFLFSMKWTVFVTSSITYHFFFWYVTSNKRYYSTLSISDRTKLTNQFLSHVFFLTRGGNAVVNHREKPPQKWPLCTCRCLYVSNVSE